VEIVETKKKKKKKKKKSLPRTSDRSIAVMLQGAESMSN